MLDQPSNDDMCQADDAEVTLDAHQALAMLEQFVVDNDELLELEARIGRFNIFDALGVARAEIRHSNFLAWLLDPNESHGQGSLFLKAILMDLLKQAPPDLRPLSPVELDGEELHGVEVQREWKNIDLLITCADPPFVIVVENKIDSDEGDEQLRRYKEFARKHFVDLRPMFVFLTTDGSEPSEDDWVPYSYADIHRVLERVRRTGQGAIGDDVEAFLEHYLRLIGSRFMDDAKIDELCQRIYKNHRQAIDLIFERVGSPQARMLQDIESFLLTRPDRWHVFVETRKRADFIPQSWFKTLSTIPFAEIASPDKWFRWWFYCRADRVNLSIELGPLQDADLVDRIAARIRNDPKEFAMAGKGLVRPVGWTRLCSRTVLRWNDGSEPDNDSLIASIVQFLDRWEDRLASLPDALRPIIAEWEQSHPEIR